MVIPTFVAVTNIEKIKLQKSYKVTKKSYKVTKKSYNSKKHYKSVTKKCN